MKIYKVKVNGKLYEVELESVSEVQGSVSAPSKNEVKEEAPKPKEAPKTSGKGVELKAPLQGTILKVNVKVGDQVKKGQPVIILEAMKLEAMKLENEVVAPADGVVSSILVNPGQSVNSQDVLLVVGE